MKKEEKEAVFTVKREYLDDFIQLLFDNDIYESQIKMQPVQSDIGELKSYNVLVKGMEIDNE